MLISWGGAVRDLGVPLEAMTWHVERRIAMKANRYVYAGIPPYLLQRSDLSV